MKRIILTNIGIFLALLFLINLVAYPIRQWSIDKSLHKTSNILPNYNDFDNYIAFRKEQQQRQLGYYPHEVWRHLPQAGKWINVDANGFRKTLHTETLKTKSCWFLGGSVAWGAHNPDESTIPSLFSLATDTFQVHNYAEVGYNVRQSMVRLTELLSAANTADLVISLDGINEVYTLCVKDVPLDSNPKSEAIKARWREIDITGSEAILKATKTLFYELFLSNTIQLTQKLKVILFGRNHLVEHIEFYCDKSPQRAEQVAEHLLLNWEMMHEIVALRGGRFIAILQPTAITSNAKIDHISDKFFPIHNSQIRAIYPIIQRKIQERQHDWIYDFTSVLDDYPDDYIYTDICHVSPNGNQIISDAIVEKIVRKE